MTKIKKHYDALEKADVTVSVKAGGYDRYKAASYAATWAYRNNPAFIYYDKVDCTNFASQAVYAGGWKGASGLRTSPHAWYYNGGNHSLTWSVAAKFYEFAQKYSGRTKLQRYVKDLKLGDLVQVKKKGQSEIKHTTIVTGHKNGNVLLTYHSSHNRNVEFKDFQSRVGSGAQYFALNVVKNG